MERPDFLNTDPTRIKRARPYKAEPPRKGLRRWRWWGSGIKILIALLTVAPWLVKAEPILRELYWRLTDHSPVLTVLHIPEPDSKKASKKKNAGKRKVERRDLVARSSKPSSKEGIDCTGCAPQKVSELPLGKADTETKGELAEVDYPDDPPLHTRPRCVFSYNCPE